MANAPKNTRPPSSFKAFYDNFQRGNKLSSPEDLQTRRKASFATISFFWISDSIAGGVRYNEHSISSGTTENTNGSNNKAANTEIATTSATALKMEVKGKVIGIENRKALLEAFIKYNNNYINSKKTEALAKLVNEQKGAELVLPTLTVPLVIIADYKFSDKTSSIGAYEFSATFAALPREVNFKIENPKDSLKSYSIFSKDSIIKQALDSIKDFNLSDYLNNGLDYYNAFMAKYQDIRSAAENIKNTAESLASLTSNLLGDDNIVSDTTKEVNSIIKDPLAVASNPLAMLGTIGKVFTGLGQTKGLAFKRRKTYKDIINKKPEPITNAPYNAVKIINQRFINQYVKSLAFISYCDELLNSDYEVPRVSSDFILSKDIIEEQNELKELFITLNPSSNTEELTKIKEQAVNFLLNQQVNSYNLAVVTTNPVCLPQFLHDHFGGVDYNDAVLLQQLNPNINPLKVEGEIVVPKR